MRSPTIRRCTSPTSATGWPSTATIRSSGRRPAAGRGRATERRHDPGGHGRLEPARVADGDDELADAEVLRIPELGGEQRVGRGPEDGEVGERIGAGDLGAAL